jgi:ribosomal protein S18 acetylase RimI-like enzyme
MPRDLEQERTASPTQITESPNSVATERSDSPGQSEEGSPSVQRRFVIVPENQQVKATGRLHPYTRPLTIYDIASCVALENAAFKDPRDRATREKFEYRLSKCGELCLGIFVTVEPDSGLQAETLATGRPVETSRSNGAISVLIGHVIAAKTNDKTATDASMSVPEDWKSPHPKPSELGHQEAGRTIVLHSVAILPAFQGRGLGRVLMMAYRQQMNGAGIADRLALIAHDYMIPWYEKFGFMNLGSSKTQFGGGGWYDMVFELKSLAARAPYG